MRRKNEAVLSFESSDDGLPKVIRDYRARYRAISQVLDDNPKILSAVHKDILTLSEGDSSGREGDYTSENILRALLVQHLEGLPFRDTIIRIGGDPFLQDFLRMRKRAVMDFTFLDRCFLAIRSDTWRRVNELLGQYGIAEEMVSTNVIRTDTTVVESNIHYPTDASLLWDAWRVASRLLVRAREIAPASCPHRFHDRKIKRLYLYVTRYMPSKSESRQRKVKAAFRTLIERTGWIVAIAGEFCAQAASRNNSAVAAVALELKPYLPSMRTIVATTTRAQIEGQTVPASDRVFSLFEQHTELIKRGRREKPVEFGHKVLLCQTVEKFITDYEVYEKQLADCDLTESVIRRHEKLFGTRPEVLAADKGFCPAAAKFEELAQQVDTLAIPRRMRDFVDKVLAHWQAFRAGIEGTISGLKRAFRLIRCFFRGFRSFSAAVGLGVFCHNLIVLAEHVPD
ncbi:MAG TPA: transposase [Thermoguttaceae bacterium]|nr:transposase [Thermoguttaceae bacterium]